MSQWTLSGVPFGDRVGLDSSSGGSKSTGPQMASGDPSFCDLPDREASSVLLPASDSRIAGTDALLQPWDDLLSLCLSSDSRHKESACQLRSLRSCD